jgi:dipeptidase E
MKLFLASEGKHPASITRLDNFVGGLSNKRIAYIPTASNGEIYGKWMNGASYKTIQSLSENVYIVEFETCNERNLEDRLGRPDIIWIAGGYAGYLLYWMRRVGFDRLLPKLLASGTTYVGSSAGSWVASDSQDIASWFIDGPEPGAQIIPGLNLVNFYIYPHYNESQYEQIQNNFKQGTLYLLKNGEAVTVDGNTIEVLGETRIISK